MAPICEHNSRTLLLLFLFSLVFFFAPFAKMKLKKERDEEINYANISGICHFSFSICLFERYILSYFKTKE